MKKVECLENPTVEENGIHHLRIQLLDNSCGLFGSKIIGRQFEKIESVLSKRYIKLPFGIRVLI